MGGEVGVVAVVLEAGEADVAVLEEDQVRHGAGDQHVGADVELPPFQQQRVRDVPVGIQRAFTH